VVAAGAVVIKPRAAVRDRRRQPGPGHRRRRGSAPKGGHW
jgi:hypothetical protein